MGSPQAYDKAKWHYGGEFPEDLPASQAFVHTGMYLGWIICRELYSGFFGTEVEDLIDKFRNQEVTGTYIYEWWDGALIEDMLNDEGNAFTQTYFDFERGSYLRDYEELLGADLPSLYHVQDTWENFEIIRHRIDDRFARWRSARGKKWWEVWK